MNLRNAILVSGLLVALGASASPLTPGEALQRARAGKTAKVAARISSHAVPVYIAKSESGFNAAYVFNNAGGGFLITSADDVAYPVLGYSETGSIDVENMSPTLKWWLGEYGRQIEWASKHGANVASRPAAPAEWSAIAPLVTTKWDQGSPYNDQCPKVDGVACYTGCVATSIAQVMNYHQWPEFHGEGIIQYTPRGQVNRRLTLNFALKDFDWDNMLDVYKAGSYTEEQADAVAYLMKCAGYSVKMNYGTQASGANGSTIGNSLRTYFGYDGNCRSEMRLVYSASEWTKKVYENLKNVGPIVINGHPLSEAGHSFVCDGYDGNGFFHFNWGWSGMSDGYYALDAMNPDAQGIGGYEGGFNFGVNGIFGIQPPTGEPVVESPDRVLQYGNTIATISGKQLTFGCSDWDTLGWANGCDHDIRCNLGVMIEGEDGQKQYIDAKFGSNSMFILDSSGSYYPYEGANAIRATLPDLADGSYRVGLVSQQEGTSDWYPFIVPYGYYDYVTVNVENGNYTVVNHPVVTIQFSDFNIETDVYMRKFFHMKAKVTNPADYEISVPVNPVVLNSNGTLRFEGDGITISVGAGETIEYEWNSRLKVVPGQQGITSATKVKIELYNAQTGRAYPNTAVEVDIMPQPSSTKVITTGASFSGAAMLPATIGGVNFPAVPHVGDPSNVVYNFSMKCSRGYYDGTITMHLYKANSYENPTEDAVCLREQFFQAWPFLAADKTVAYEVPFSIPEPEINGLYYIVVNYTDGNSTPQLNRSNFILTDGAGVDDLEIDDESEELLFNLQGVRIDEPREGEMVIVRKGGKTYKKLWK